MEFIKKLFSRKKAPFRLEGQKLILQMSDGSIEEKLVPNKWEDLTVNQVIEIQKGGEDLSPIELFCILTDIKKELAYMIDLDTIERTSASFSFLSDADALAKSFEAVPFDYLKKDIGKMMFGTVYQMQLLIEQENSEPWQDLEVRKKIAELVLGFEIGSRPYSEWLRTMDFFYNASLLSLRNSKESARPKRTRFQNRLNTRRTSAALLGFITLFMGLLIMTYVCGTTYIAYRLIEYLCCS